MKTKKVLNLLSKEVQRKILQNTINDFDSDFDSDLQTAALGFYQFKLNRKFDRQGLGGFFVYSRTPEGSVYWNELSEALVKVVFTK